MKRVLLTLAFAVAGLVLATPALPHASLLSSIPADGALVEAPPSTLTLNFNEAFSPSVLRLVTPEGTEVELENFRLSGRVVTIQAPALGNGTHVLNYRGVSFDGHPIGGAIVFSVGVVTGMDDHAIAPVSDPIVRSLIWTVRVVLYFALFVGVAGAFFINWIGSAVSERTKKTLRTAMVFGLVSVPLAFALQGVDLLGVSAVQVLSPSVWRASFESTYVGTLGAATVALALGLQGLRGSKLSKWAAAGGLLAVGIAFSVSGHASRAPPQALTWLVVLIHTTNVAFWAGSLLPLASLLKSSGRAAHKALARFSAVIPFAIAPMAVTGVLLALVQLTEVSDLWTTSYGRLLLAKLAVVAGLAFLAFHNRHVLTPLAASAPSAGFAALRRSIVIELALTAIVFGIVAGWRFTPPPRTIGETTQVQASAPVRPFFIHLHGTNVAADITVTPGQVGPVAITVNLQTIELTPLSAQELVITLSNETAGIEPIEREAVLLPDGNWEATGFVVPFSGVWTVGLEALISDFDRRAVAGPVVIADPTAARAEQIPAAEGEDHQHAVGPAVDVNDPLQVLILDAAEAPAIAMSARPAGGANWTLSFEFERFRFGTAEDGAIPIPGVGHGHVLVNGQYIGDLSGPTHQLALPGEGVFEIYVGLSALDHRSLVVDGALVSARTVILVDDRAAIADERTVIDIPVVVGPDAPTYRVRQGETVELRLTSATAEVVHFHGYDIETAVGPRSPVTLLFNAAFAGRFVAEAHDVNETAVFYLEVLP